jgi:hypothetical protein
MPGWIVYGAYYSTKDWTWACAQNIRSGEQLAVTPGSKQAALPSLVSVPRPHGVTVEMGEQGKPRRVVRFAGHRPFQRRLPLSGGMAAAIWICAGVATSHDPPTTILAQPALLYSLRGMQ